MSDVLLMDEVLPKAAVFDFSLEAAQNAVKEYVASSFSFLTVDIIGKSKNSGSQDLSFTEGMQGEKVLPGLVLLLAELLVFIEQSTIPRIIEHTELREVRMFGYLPLQEAYCQILLQRTSFRHAKVLRDSLHKNAGSLGLRSKIRHLGFIKCISLSFEAVFVYCRRSFSE